MDLMYLEDAPIKCQEEDLLHRSNFAKRLGKSILDMKTDDGYCIGLFGPWGSGKSSVINMVLEEIRTLSSERENAPVIMYFNPWNFSSSEQLLRQYFLMLSKQFTARTNQKLQTIGDEIKKYAGMLEGFGDIGKAIGAGGEILADIINRNSIAYNSNISEQKELLIEKLKGIEQNVIIVIDDIDRLSNEEIKLIFQLVNAVARFPHTIYLLSFDKEIVARALTEVQQYDGERYLEKIIQIPIEIPQISNDYLWEALFAKLTELLINHKGTVFEQNYWGKIFSEGISNYIYNIRDIIRLINVLSIKMDMIGNEVNFADLVAITVIELKIPELYRWIKANKSRLVGGPTELMNWKNKEEIEKENFKEMEALVGEQAEKYISFLKILFPYYNSKNGAGRNYRETELLRKRRIGHIDIFDRYFSLEMDDKSISRETFNYAIFQMDEVALENYIDIINDNKSVISFLKELQGAENEIEKERIPILIRVLVKKAHILEGTDYRLLFNISAFSMVEYRIEELFLNLDSEEKCYQLFSELLKKADQNTLPVLAVFLNHRELAYGRLAGEGVEKGEKIISLEQLKNCETYFCEKVTAITTETCLLDLHNSRMVLYLFESFNASQYASYMLEILNDDLNKLKYLEFSVERWESGSAITWRINNGYTKMFDDSALQKAIANCENDGSIWALCEELQHRVIAYVLCKEGVTSDDNEVNDIYVTARLEEMKRNMVKDKA